MTAPHRVSAVACALSLAVLGGAGIGLSRTESVIERAYVQAFDRIGAGRVDAAGLNGGFDPAHVRLSSLPINDAFGAKLAVGDRITVSQAEGGATSYEVIEVTPLAQEPAARGLARSRMKVVTAVTSGQIPSRMVRFLIDGEPEGSSTPIERPHAL